MPARDELILDASGDPVLSTATVAPSFNMPASSKPSGPGIVYSPEYKAQKLANALSNLPSLGSSAISKIASDAQSNRSLQTLLQTGVVDKTMLEGFAEMGPSVSQTKWLSIQKRWGLTNAQLSSLKTAHANHFGMAPASVSTPVVPAKKPNYLLWAAIAVGGFFIVRRFLK